MIFLFKCECNNNFISNRKQKEQDFEQNIVNQVLVLSHTIINIIITN